MGIDEVARCAATGSVLAQRTYGERLFRIGRQEEAETWFEAAVTGSGGAFAKGETALSIARRLPWDPVPPGSGEINAAERWYRRAFDLGSDTAGALLGVQLKWLGDQNGANTWFERSVERSSGYTASLIASNLTGSGNKPQTANEAAQRARLLGRGAELGSLSSMNQYAAALSAGKGVGRNEAEAFRWHEAAARHQHASAWEFVKLAERHAEGDGTLPDLEAAAVALNAAKRSKWDSSDTGVVEKIRSLERRLSAAEAAKR